MRALLDSPSDGPRQRLGTALGEIETHSDRDELALRQCRQKLIVGGLSGLLASAVLLS
jgi:hypothetical protein